MKTIALFLALAFVAAVSADGHGTSYVKRHDDYHGSHQISVETHDKHGHKGHHIDYVHHPSYKYEYGIDDPKAKDHYHHHHSEHRDGKKTDSEYSVKIGHGAHGGHGGHGHH
jgi:hypothetical protein